MSTQVLLDTNFIISCINKKIDFFEDLKFKGFQILIPRQVIVELKKLKVELALKLLEKEKKYYKFITLNKNYVDKGIIEFAKNNPRSIIATLDKDLKNKIMNQNLIIRGSKKLEIV